MDQSKSTRGESRLETKDYWQSYHLNVDPFTLNNEESYYPVAEWEKHLDLIYYLIHYSNVIITVTGERGCGKSLLQKQFIQQNSDGGLAIHVLKDAGRFTVDDLVGILATAFQLKTDLDMPTQEVLEAQLEELQYYEIPCVLVFRDAHLLPKDTLTILMELIAQQSDTQMRLHVVLFGEPRLNKRINQLNTHEQDLVYNIDMEPLTQQQTKQYLLQRFRAAGLVGEFPLKDGQVNRIWQLSRGNPSRINQFAKQVMLGKGDPKPLPKPVPIKRVVGKNIDIKDFLRKQKKTISIGVVLLLALLAVSWWSRVQQQNKSEVKTPIAQEIEVPALLKHKQLLKNVLPYAPGKAPGSAKAKVVAKLTPKPAPVQHSASPEFFNKMFAKHLSPAVSQQILALQKNLPHPYYADLKTEAPAPAAKPVKKHVSFFSKKPLPKSEVKTPAQPKVVTKPKAKTSASNSKNAYSRDEKFLLKTPANRYTLQLMASIDRKKLLKEARVVLNKRKYPSYLFRYGPNWHVLVYGVYDSFDAAKKAIKTVPKSLRKRIKPWPRKMSLIHDEIKRKR